VPTIGLILAGGRGSRLGHRDKAMVDLAGRPLITHAIGRLGPQVDVLAINANGDPGRFDFTALPVIPDLQEPAVGPLGGVLAGLNWVRQHHPDAAWLVTTACDTPFIPEDMVKRLLEQGDRADVIRAASCGGIHHLVAAWRMDLAEPLHHAIRDGISKVALFAERFRVATVRFNEEPDPFLNINTPDDLAAAEARLTGRP
jgi:molybdopterin-guanine dinucleotide biosynthesis protein A